MLVKGATGIFRESFIILCQEWPKKQIDLFVFLQNDSIFKWFAFHPHRRHLPIETFTIWMFCQDSLTFCWKKDISWFAKKCWNASIMKVSLTTNHQWFKFITTWNSDDRFTDPYIMCMMCIMCIIFNWIFHCVYMRQCLISLQRLAL